MAAPESRLSPPSLEELSTRGAYALLLPWILGIATASNSSPHDVAVYVHQPSRSVLLFDGSMDVESLLRENQSMEGPSPASKASIESLPAVRITDPNWECAICLTEYEVKGEECVKEMPCRHKFHANCINKWLGIRGSCPVCRLVMPAAESKESVERGGWTIRVYFSRVRRNSDPNTDMDTGTGHGEGDLGRWRYDGSDDGTEMDNIN
ncbi:E3 ubiquitin-protein ligase MPSR1-like [Andrographis paniculata]|uniref:E3 ubiquitin-protein ligase MPSR1-like n=1 Tax=Andrographis paniculata TaxID=175694 RepID=UPI0021E6FF82|nr:E3 ubiquitin-protein ligase MPSR1-like [Andrographis paniculata]